MIGCHGFHAPGYLIEAVRAQRIAEIDAGALQILHDDDGLVRIGIGTGEIGARRGHGDDRLDVGVEARLGRIHCRHLGAVFLKPALDDQRRADLIGPFPFQVQPNADLGGGA